MKLPAHEFLDKEQIPYRTLKFSESIELEAASVAQALGFRDRQMVKTLIFESDRGEKMLVMIGGDQSVQSGKLKRIVGSRDIKMASPEVVHKTTGYKIGSIPPFHWQPSGFRSFIDVSLIEEKELGVGAGQRGHEIILTPHDLIHASAAMVVSVVKE